MKYRVVCAALVVSLLSFSAVAGAREVVLPAGTLLQCTLNEPNLSSKTVEIGDPVLCHLRGVTSFGQQAFPRGSYLVGHLEAAKDPGHFVGKGYLKLQFDRIGLPSGDMPLQAKVISTRGYKVDKEGKIDGKGHAKRDVVEWMLPPLWPWKVIMLPARGPRPQLKGETVLSLRLMDDVQLPQVASASLPARRSLSVRPQSNSFGESDDSNTRPVLSIRSSVVKSNTRVSAAVDVPHASYASFVSTSAASGVPAAVASKPVFILNSGTVLAVGSYQYQDGRLTYTLEHGGGGVVSTDEVDWNATTRINNQRGVRVTLHAGRSNQETSGF
jgi:hypothetical protein